MVGESNKNVFLLQIDTSRFAEFENPSSRYREWIVHVHYIFRNQTKVALDKKAQIIIF